MDSSKQVSEAAVPPREEQRDLEEQKTPGPVEDTNHKSAFKSLGFLDQLLALWILLAMIVGILLGNFVPNTGPALQKGQFVGVSIPIGTP